MVGDTSTAAPTTGDSGADSFDAVDKSVTGTTKPGTPGGTYDAEAEDDQYEGQVKAAQQLQWPELRSHQVKAAQQLQDKLDHQVNEAAEVATEGHQAVAEVV